MTVNLEEVYKIINETGDVNGVKVHIGSGDIVSDAYVDTKVYKFYWGTVNDKDISPRIGYRPIARLGKFGSLGGCLLTDYEQAANYAKYAGDLLELQSLVVEFMIPDGFYFNKDEYKLFIKSNTPARAASESANMTAMSRSLPGWVFPVTAEPKRRTRRTP